MSPYSPVPTSTQPLLTFPPAITTLLSVPVGYAYIIISFLIQICFCLLLLNKTFHGCSLPIKKSNGYHWGYHEANSFDHPILSMLLCFLSTVVASACPCLHVLSLCVCICLLFFLECPSFTFRGQIISHFGVKPSAFSTEVTFLFSLNRIASLFVTLHNFVWIFKITLFEN